jgi:osmoprotectant transport system ATP-binding protein
LRGLQPLGGLLRFRVVTGSLGDRSAMIRLEAVSKHYPNGTVAVRELTLEVPDGEVAVLVGPSGCGKTTILRMINRLIEPTSGRIYIENEDVTHVDPVHLRRRIGYVIQQIGLFPHQTIEHNVATVPKMLGWNRQRQRTRVDELLDLVGLDPAQYRDRYPHQLSGGQRQRVGVARALAADPPVLLMDEPFGAIDPITRSRLQDEFKRLQADLKKTIVFVTHDVEEAVKMGDRIAILNIGGVLEQYDVPSQILGHPATDFVASFVGGDRAIKQLKVTTIDREQLEHPQTVTPDTPLEKVRQLLVDTSALSIPVIDAAGVLRGRVRAKDADGDATASDRLVRVDAWVDVRDTLEHALANTLLSDDGWIGVLDGERYLGVLTPDGVYRSLRGAIDTPPA